MSKLPEETSASKSETDELTENASLITDCLWLGSEDAGHAPLDVLLAHDISAIVVAGFGLTAMHESSGKLKYLKLKAIDLPVYDITADVRKAHEFILEECAKGGTVLVHCARGKSRSASVVIGHLILAHHISFEEASFRVRKRRREISVNAGFEKSLKLLATSILAEGH